MKKLISLILIFIMSLNLWACGAGQPEIPVSEAIEIIATNISDVDQLPTADLKNEVVAINSCKPKAKLPDGYVEITFPNIYNDKDEIDNMVKKSHFKSVVINENNTVTFITTKENQEELLANYAAGINEDLNNIVEDDTFSYTKIDHNNNYTIFTLYTPNTEINFYDSVVLINLYLAGFTYTSLSGKEADNIHVVILNEQSGDTINEYNTDEQNLTFETLINSLKTGE